MSAWLFLTFLILCRNSRLLELLVRIPRYWLSQSESSWSSSFEDSSDATELIPVICSDWYLVINLAFDILDYFWWHYLAYRHRTRYLWRVRWLVFAWLSLNISVLDCIVNYIWSHRLTTYITWFRSHNSHLLFFSSTFCGDLGKSESVGCPRSQVYMNCSPFFKLVMRQGLWLFWQRSYGRWLGWPGHSKNYFCPQFFQEWTYK